MKKEIEEIQSQNGNSSFTQKELLWYLVHKVDLIQNTFTSQINTCANRFITKKTIYWMSGILMTLFTTFLLFK